MYFLYKQGIGGRGVFWIGKDLIEGKKMADHAANKDVDDYHKWILFEYLPPNKATNYDNSYDNEQHKVVYIGKRDDD